MSTPITVTVVIPAYNVGPYIGRAIKSVLAQTRLPDEIIVVDDGSTDDTAANIKTFGEKVKYLHQNNAGASTARNRGIQAATGDWIAFLDADDEWLSKHLQAQIHLLDRHSHLAWSTGNYFACLCDENRSGPKVLPSKAKALLNGKDFFDDYFFALRAGIWGCTDTMIIKRDALLAAGLFRPSQREANDLDMWWRIAYLYPQIGYIPEPLAIYHLTIPHSITKINTNIEVECELIERHLNLAQQHHRLDAFGPTATKLVRLWIRSILFDHTNAPIIRDMLKRFDALLPAPYKIFLYFLTTFPRATAYGCNLISRFVRFFHLRREVVRPPR